MKIKWLTISSIVLLISWQSLSYSGESALIIFKGKLAFRSTRYLLDEKYKSDGVCLLKGGRITFLAKARDPAWSPDGSLLMVATNDNAIHIIKEDGLVVEKIPIFTRGHHPQWHPKEKKIFYVGEEAEGAEGPKPANSADIYNAKIYMYDRGKKESVLIFYDETKKYDISSLFISPGGKHLAFRAAGELEGAYIIGIDGKGLELVYKSGIIYGWFPYGNNLCYGANTGDGGEPLTKDAGYIYKYNEDTKKREMAGKGVSSGDIKLSRDGRYVYFSTRSGISAAPIEDVSKTEMIVESAVMGPNNGRKSHEFESDWF